MTALHIDFETRSELDLRVVGLHRYARHPSTDVWCMAFSADDAEPIVMTPADTLRGAIRNHIAERGTVYAHNAAFELEI